MPTGFTTSNCDIIVRPYYDYYLNVIHDEKKYNAFAIGFYALPSTTAPDPYWRIYSSIGYFNENDHSDQIEEPQLSTYTIICTS